MVNFKITGGQVRPEFDMPSFSTILELKQMIKTLLDVEIARQNLCFGEIKLDDNCKEIESYDFGESATLTLHVEPLASELKYNIRVNSDSRDEEYELSVNDSYTVKDLKAKIGRRWGIYHIDHIALFRLNQKMDDARSLVEYYVCPNCKVVAVINDVEAR